MEGFSAYLAQRDRRNTTIKRHTNNLRYLGKFVDQFEKEKIDKFLLKLKAEGKANSYLNSIINTIRLYAQYLNLSPELQKYKQFKKTTSIKATLSDEEVETFLALPRRSHQPEKHRIKMSMFWALIAFTGMRPGECAMLEKKHFDWGRGVISIEISKTNQPGIVPIPPNIKDQIKAYLEGLEGTYLFPSARGGASYNGMAILDDVAWGFDFHKRLKQIGLERPHLTPYSFRHSYATRLLEENISLFHVKKLMRHNDLKSTLVYEHLTTKDLIEAQQRLPLIRKGTDPRNILNCLVEMIKSLHLEKDVRFSYQLEESDNSLKFEAYIK